MPAYLMLSYSGPRLSRTLFSVAVLGAFLGWVGCSRPEDPSQTEEAWNAINDPSFLGLQTRPLSTLALSASLVTPVPWGGYYWPTYKGGISFRWQTDPGRISYRDYLYSLPSRADLQAMNETELNLLSPAEKYDLYTGKADLPLANAERKAMLADVVDDDIASWHGICHGWAAASTQEEQPGEKVVTQLRDGRKLTFYYSDLEALLEQTYGDVKRYGARLIGGRCNETDVIFDSSGRPTASECRDVNPGTFHLALAGLLGEQGKSFVADFSAGVQVWNYPIMAFSSKLGKPRPLTRDDPAFALRAPGTVSLVDVETTVEVAASNWPTTVRENTYRRPHEMSYTLELDRDGRIIGGEWTSSEHPDFLWLVTSKPRDGGYVLSYAKVQELLAWSHFW